MTQLVLPHTIAESRSHVFGMAGAGADQRGSHTVSPYWRAASAIRWS